MKINLGGIEMKVELKSKENSKAVFTIEIGTEEFKEAIQKAYQQNKHMFSIPGFRKGKAPRQIIESNYGKDVFYEDAVNVVLGDKYEPALKELELEPIDYPKVDILDEISTEKPFNVEFTVELRPIAELGNYKDIKIDITKPEVTEEMVNAEIDKERENNSRLVNITDRVSEDGDTLNIDFEGFVDEEPFEGGKAEAYDLVLGSKTFIPGFEDQLIGVKPEEELDVKVTFPEDYHESLKDKDAVFKVKVNSIKRKELPELDDDFAMDVSEFDTLDEYKNDLKAKLEEASEQQFTQNKINQAVNALVDITEVEVPEVMVEDQIKKDFEDFTHRISQMGIDLDTYYSITQSDEDTVKEELREPARKRVKTDLALEAFAKAENVEVSDEEIDNELRELAKVYAEKDIEKFVSEYKENNDLYGITEFIRNRNTLDKLVETVEFNIVEEVKEEVEEETESE